MSDYVILVDGGFLKRKLGSRQSPLDVHVFKHFIDELGNHEYLKKLNLYRIYYYDAPPLEGSQQRPLQGGLQDFGNSALAGINKRLLHGLGHFPRLELRLGELVFRGWQVRQDLFQDSPNVTITSEDLTPVIHQRGVDVQIGLDIAQLSIGRQMHTIVLIGGDSDFVPAMKVARQGCQLILVTLGHTVRDSMYVNSDLVIEVLDGKGKESGSAPGNAYPRQHGYYSSQGQNSPRFGVDDHQQAQSLRRR